MTLEMKTRPVSKPIGLNWIGTKVKEAVSGLCPFCGAELNIDSPEHKCRALPDTEDKIYVEVFKDSSVLMIGRKEKIDQIEIMVKKQYGIKGTIRKIFP